MKLTLFAVSPMYFQAPVYRRLASEPGVDFEVIFASDAGVRQHEAGYGKPMSWDVPMLDGFAHRFLKRASRNPLANRTTDLRDWDIATEVRRRRGVWMLHGYNSVTHMTARAAIGAMRLPWVFREENNLLSPRPPVRRAIKHVGLRAFLTGAEAVYIGEQNRRWLEHFGVGSDRLHRAPYAVPNAVFAKQRKSLERERDSLRSQRGVTPEDVLVLSAIRLIPKKQPLSLLIAFADALKESPSLRLRIVGDGPMRQACVDLARTLRIDQRVSFAGFVPLSRVGCEYAAADLFALFSGWDETWGMVVNEAMNFALPVIASDRVGSATDLVIPDETGYIVPHEDPGALAAQFSRLAAQPELRQSLGNAALEHVQAFTPERAAEGILEASRAAMSRRA